MVIKKTTVEFLLRLSLTFMFILAIILGLSKIIFSIWYLPARADEYLSLIQAGHPFTFSLLKLTKKGMDNSYLHNLITGLSFKILPQSLQTLRFISLFFWAVGLYVFYRILKRTTSFFVVSTVLAALTGFSILGDFIARDGRFYSLLFFISVTWFWVLVESLNREKAGFSEFLQITIITFLGFLTSLNFILLPTVAISALIINSLIKKPQSPSKGKTTLVLISIIIGFCLYYLFAWIDFFPAYFANGFTMAIPRESVKLEDLPILNVFRWISVPAIPFIKPETEIIVFGLVMAAITILQIKTKQRSGPGTHGLLLISTGIITISILAIHTLLILVNPVKWWYFRYYTPVFFTLAFIPAFYLITPLNEHLKKCILIYMVFGFFISQSMKNDRIEQISQQSQSLEVIAEKLISMGIMEENKHLAFELETDDGYAEKRLFAALFCRYPEFRKKMAVLMPDEWEKERTRSHSINILKAEFSEFRYFYKSEYQKTKDSKKTHLVITNRKNTDRANHTELDWENLVIIQNPTE